MQDKTQEQKAVLVLSIASVLLMTVFLNQWLVRGPEQNLATGGNRGVASFEPSSFAKDVKWEHDLAKRMASEKALMASSLAESPTLRDDLVFGFLEGKYGMKLSQGRIESLEFIDAQAGEQPLKIEDKAAFLKKYSEAFGVQFAEVSYAAQAEGAEQVFHLIDASKEIVGKAHFKVDDQGRVQSISFNH